MGASSSHGPRPARTLSDATGAVNSVALSGGVLAAGSYDKKVRIYRTETGELLRTLSDVTEQAVSSVALSGGVLAAGGGDKKVRIYRTETGELLRTLSDATEQVWSVALSGGVLAAGGYDKKVRIYRTDTWELLRTLSDATGYVWSVALSGGVLAAGGDDKKVRIYRTETGELLRTLSDTTGQVLSVALSGGVLAAGGDDKKVRIYRTETGELLHTLTDATGSVWSVALSGGVLAAAGNDKNVRIYDGTLWNLGGMDKATLDLLEGWCARESVSGQELLTSSSLQEACLQSVSLKAGPRERLTAAFSAARVTTQQLQQEQTFMQAYRAAQLPTKSVHLLAALDGLLTASGIPDAHGFYLRLENEIYQHVTDLIAGEKIPDAAQRLWTSAETNCQGLEFCQLLNAATRPGASSESLTSACILARCINTNLLQNRKSVEERRFPREARCIRGGGLPDEHKAFFIEKKSYRVPNFLATAFENEPGHPLAKDDPGHPHKAFMDRAFYAGHPCVRWEILLDERGDPRHPDYNSGRYACKHLNVITKQAPNVPDEKEMLFVPYSVFTVDSVTFSNDPRPSSPHVIVLKAAVDNLEWPEDLPLAPWS